MSDADPERSKVTADTGNKPAEDTPPQRNDEYSISQPSIDEQQALQDDLNPRSPKRRRLSPATDEIEVDFEAAAARALAISLGVDQPDVTSPSPVPQAPQQPTNTTAPGSRNQDVAPTEKRVRMDNLPALDEVATQLLSTLAKLNHLEIGEMLFGPPSQRGQDYRALKAKFEQIKREFLINSPFTSSAALGVQGIEQIEVLRKTNMATFMSSIFSGEIGLRIMDINFLDVFVPEGGRLLKAQASIYLELKTQAFIAAKRTAPAMLNQVMLDLFPPDMEKHLLAKRPGAKSLAPSEVDFLKRIGSRRDILYADMRNNRLDNLELRYRWDDFSREVNSYLSKNYDIAHLGARDRPDQASPIPAQAHLQQDQMEGSFALATGRSQPIDSANSNALTEPDFDFNIDDFVAQAARAAEIALQGESYVGYASVPSTVPPISQPLAPPSLPAASTFSPSNAMSTPTRSTPAQTPPPTKVVNSETANTAETEFQQYNPVTPGTSSATNGLSSEGNNGDVPHRSQTAPTQVLYERARLVTTDKASPPSRKPNPPSHRRPWTNEEENALMTGLDQVKGPHWSQILAMYGPGGTINESLKDRNQVQLKDKARNLKLFFLKAGIEVPYYLQAVTGDLKTRAPGQAEKREAKERGRVNLDEDEIQNQADDSNVDINEDLEVDPQSPTDQEEVYDVPPAQGEAVKVQEKAAGDVAEDNDPNGLDMEALIARAAASAHNL